MNDWEKKIPLTRGYYWVKLKEKGTRWTIGFCNFDTRLFPEKWIIMGSNTVYSTSDFDLVGQLIIDARILPK